MIRRSFFAAIAATVTGLLGWKPKHTVESALEDFFLGLADCLIGQPTPDSEGYWLWCEDGEHLHYRLIERNDDGALIWRQYMMVNPGERGEWICRRVDGMGGLWYLPSADAQAVRAPASVRQAYVNGLMEILSESRSDKNKVTAARLLARIDEMNMASLAKETT